MLIPVFLSRSLLPELCASLLSTVSFPQVREIKQFVEINKINCKSQYKSNKNEENPIVRQANANAKANEIALLLWAAPSFPANPPSRSTVSGSVSCSWRMMRPIRPNRSSQRRSPSSRVALDPVHRLPGKKAIIVITMRMIMRRVVPQLVAIRLPHPPAPETAAMAAVPDPVRDRDHPDRDPPMVVV